MFGGIASAVIHTLYGAGFGFVASRSISTTGGWIGLAVGAVIGLLFGLLYAWAVAAGSVYSRTVTGVLLFLVDHTWSLLNTVAGTIYLAAHLLVGHSLDRAASKDSGRINVTEGMGAGVAMTVGNVVAGANPSIQRHEDVHVMQGRVLGPLYLPLLVLNYIMFTIFPIWLIYHDRANRPINSVGRYFVVGVYAHVIHEEIAYAVQGTPPS
jgi:hypothetical protein